MLDAARHLGVLPARAAVFKDATTGVEAARAGDFALVVGVWHCARSRSLLRVVRIRSWPTSARCVWRSRTCLDAHWTGTDQGSLHPTSQVATRLSMMIKMPRNMGKIAPHEVHDRRGRG